MKCGERLGRGKVGTRPVGGGRGGGLRFWWKGGLRITFPIPGPIPLTSPSGDHRRQRILVKL